MTAPVPGTPGPDIEALRRAWFVDGFGCAFTDRDRLQAWHDAERHEALHPINGSCFCCCEACDPT